ncbi:MAG: hypothetical protein ACOC0P_01470, partial [Planctomycetota bacterium]
DLVLIDVLHHRVRFRSPHAVLPRCAATYADDECVMSSLFWVDASPCFGTCSQRTPPTGMSP